MRKKFTYAVSLLMAICGIGLFAHDVAAATGKPLSPEEKAKVMAQRQQMRTERQQVTQGPQRVIPDGEIIMGGAQNNRPLRALKVAENGYQTDDYFVLCNIKANDLTELNRWSGADSYVYNACFMGDKFFVIHNDVNGYNNTIEYAFYTPDLSEKLSSNQYTKSTPYIIGTGLTYDKATNRPYGVFFDGGDEFTCFRNQKLCWIQNNALDPVVQVGDLSEKMRSLAVDKDGQLWGLNFAGTALYKINKETAACTKIADVTLPLNKCFSGDDIDGSNMSNNAYESMTIDPETGDFYVEYACDYSDTYIVRIDAETYNVEELATFGYEGDDNVGFAFVGLHFEDVEQASGAPVEVAFVEVKPVGVENKATVKFTMPTVDTDGGDLTGKTLNYRIADSTGANNLATGTAEAGTDVTAEVNVSQAGETTVIVYTSLNDVESRGTSGKGFIGPDTPVIAAKPNVRINGQQATISWTAAVPYNNGNLGEPINYVVTRMPDNYTVGTTTELTITDNIASEYKVGYTYKVMPKYTVNGTDYTGDAVESRVSYIGKYLELPFYETFDNEDRFLSYEAVDGNGDGNYWEFNAYREAADYTGTSYDANDDLLIGPFKMQAGSTYTFKMQADGFSVAERVAVYAGTRENLTTEIVPDTRIYPTVAMLNVNEQFAPEADGDYYFDIRALSDANSQHLYIYEVSVEEMAGNLPAAPSDLKVIPASDTATIHFRLPSTTINGEELTSLSYAFLYRNGDCIKTITTDVNPGAEMDVVDEEYVEDGSYTYSVTAMNDAGEGLAAEITVFRGADIPGKVRNLNIYEDVNTSGLLHITFDAPEAGYRGGYVDPENVEYTFDYITMSNGSNTVNLGKGTTHTYQLPAAVTKQDILAGSITATNNIGDAREWVTSICTVGPALDLPLLESWAGMSQSSGLWPAMNLDEDAELYESMWDISDGAVTDIKPYDADGGMLAFATEKNGGGYRTFTPRVSLDGAANPTLVFYYNYTEKATEFNVEILVEDQPLTSVQAIDLDAAEANTWQRCEIPLKDYVGKKYVQLAFSARGNVGKGIVAIDNLSVTDYLNKDLSVTSFTAPKRADVNSEIEFTATVRNNGADLIARGDYNVQLFKNGSVITELQGVDLAGSSEHQFTLTDTPTAADPEMSEYYVAVIYEDGNQENNISQVSTVHIVSLNLPVVTDLKALNGEAVTLSWTAPTASDIPGASTIESFEDYNPFIIDNIGNWTLYDGDGMDTAILAFSTGVLDYEHIGEKMAWQVIDPIEAGIPLESWMPRTGDKMLVSFQACLGGYRDVDSEDWLISPRLDGSEQTITFYARTAARDYSPELFDFKISSDNNATSSFNTLEEDVAVNYDAEDWTEFSFQVPEGTRHFAIVHKSNNQLAMLIDDITYIADGSEPMDIKLQGFNVYRNGVKLNDNPVAAAENSYVDSNVADGEEYTYGVTAVWDKGESAMSETVTITVSGVEGVTTHELRISGRQNAILVEGGLGEQIDVYTIDGMRVASAIAQGETMIPVAANGIYVVKAGNSVAKIVVH